MKRETCCLLHKSTRNGANVHASVDLFIKIIHFAPRSQKYAATQQRNVSGASNVINYLNHWHGVTCATATFFRS